MSLYHHGNLREALISRAIEVVDAKGVEGLSMRQISKDLGVSHAAPSRHFKDKSSLLTAIVKASLSELIEVILEPHAQSTNAILELNEMAQRTIKWALHNSAKFSVMTNPDVSRYADDDVKVEMRVFAANVMKILKAAQAAGFRPHVSERALLLYAIGASRGIAATMTDPLVVSVLGAQDDPELVKQLADQLVPL